MTRIAKVPKRILGNIPAVIVGMSKLIKNVPCLSALGMVHRNL